VRGVSKFVDKIGPIGKQCQMSLFKEIDVNGYILNLKNRPMRRLVVTATTRNSRYQALCASGSKSGSGTGMHYYSSSVRQKVGVPAVPVPVPQHCQSEYPNHSVTWIKSRPSIITKLTHNFLPIYELKQKTNQTFSYILQLYLYINTRIK
jgi:hypothetical protein